MKIKITQPGYATFTGQLGLAHFTNGMSDVDLSLETIAGIAAIVQCEEYNGAVDAGPADVTNDKVKFNDKTGDFDSARTPAPAKLP